MCLSMCLSGVSGFDRRKGVLLVFITVFFLYISIKAKAELVGLTKSVLDQKTEEKKYKPIVYRTYNKFSLR